MGKRARKTRWRALDIVDDHSDSEESNTNSSATSGRLTGSYQQRSYHKFPYSSQSTPRRRYQYDGGTKSTRSSSTTSETKITFNDEEYTKITTPRQDVLFKKGYLNKPKTFQSQTSTGNSTISTGYSTENGTPDHQSTDLEYESQFVFPNGFVDQNGIYYVNSYEPYPLMVFNPPTYYQEFSDSKAKRYSTGSLTESMSPNNEEVTSQDLSGGETSNNQSDYSGHPVYNIIYPGYYLNGPPNDVANSHITSEPVKKLKKRRERKLSKTVLPSGDSTDNTDGHSSDDGAVRKPPLVPSPLAEETSHQKSPEIEDIKEEPKTDRNIGCADPKTEASAESDQAQPPKDPSSTLKPDAEEFVPRVYHQNFQVPQLIPPNFVPIPLMPINDFGHHAAFIPHGIPINFLPPPPGQKVCPQFVAGPPQQVKIEEVSETNKEPASDSTATTSTQMPNVGEVQSEPRKKDIDIATVVSKLEEAVKEQQTEEVASNDTKSYKGSPRFNRSPFKRNQFNKYRSGDLPAPNVEKPKQIVRGFRKNWSSSPYRNNTYNNNNQKHVNSQETVANTKPPVSKDYSEMLKKPIKTQTNHITDQKTLVAQENATFASKIQQKPNQWISVSNRKKKRNKNVEEIDHEEENTRNETLEDEFEPYDVNLLQDVVKEETSNKEDTKIEEILTMLATNENSEPTFISTDIKIVEVSDIEKELLTANETEKTDETEEVIAVTMNEEFVKPKKKSKKGSEKALMKKVIITDIDFAETIPEDKEAVKEEIAQQQQESIKKDPVKVKEAPEKKAKNKKKKKSKKSTLEDNLSSSNTTLNATDDSYDFLLENSLVDENLEKTNLEMSLELDKIIQKGMYSSLKEKIMSLNVDAANDEFFQNLDTATKAPAKNGYSKTPDFSRIFQSTRQLLKPNSVSVEDQKDNNLEVSSNTVLLPQADTTHTFDGPMLDEEHPKVPQDEDETESKNLYPITQAVKDWMTKTREATPEVEILKSPITIYKEFGSVINQGGEESDASEDEEVTIFTNTTVVSRKNSEQDLLEFWDNDITLNKTSTQENNTIVHKTCSSEKCCSKCQNVRIEAGEDVIEVYESKYGQNEAYKNLQKENQRNCPKHGDLPYRAICCSIQ